MKEGKQMDEENRVNREKIEKKDSEKCFVTESKLRFTDSAERGP